MSDRGIDVAHTPIFQWGQNYAPELNMRIRPHLSATHDSWKVGRNVLQNQRIVAISVPRDNSEETLWTLCSVPSERQKPPKRFFDKVLRGSHVTIPRVINVDKNAAYPPAIDELKQTGD